MEWIAVVIAVAALAVAYAAHKKAHLATQETPEQRAKLAALKAELATTMAALSPRS